MHDDEPARVGNFGTERVDRLGKIHRIPRWTPRIDRLGMVPARSLLEKPNRAIGNPIARLGPNLGVSKNAGASDPKAACPRRACAQRPSRHRGRARPWVVYRVTRRDRDGQSDGLCVANTHPGDRYARGHRSASIRFADRTRFSNRTRVAKPRSVRSGRRVSRAEFLGQVSHRGRGVHRDDPNSNR